MSAVAQTLARYDAERATVPMEPDEVRAWAKHNKVKLDPDATDDDALAIVNEARAGLHITPFRLARVYGRDRLPAPNVGANGRFSLQLAPDANKAALSERGRLGGVARAEKLSPERRREIGKMGGEAGGKKQREVFD